MTDARIVELMAIAVIVHVGVDVGMVVAQENRGRMPVVRWQMSPVPRRVPRSISRSEQVHEYRRPGIIYRPYDVVRTVDVRAAYDFHMVCGVTRHFRNHGGHILINVLVKHSLNDEHMGGAVQGLEHAQIIHISVVVEVQVGEHVLGIVQQVLEFLHRLGLGECSADSLEVEIEGYVIIRCNDAGGRSSRACTWYGDCGAVRIYPIGMR